MFVFLAYNNTVKIIDTFHKRIQNEKLKIQFNLRRRKKMRKIK